MATAASRQYYLTFRFLDLIDLDPELPVLHLAPSGHRDLFGSTGTKHIGVDRRAVAQCDRDIV